jgi:prepilin-type N-terminal cleavage/methylation domain-containing protein
MYKKINIAGFTLIELLVVVLIIGILAAIALPQYLYAVEKSRAAEAFVTGKAIVRAQERYYLSNGSFTYSFDDLDLDFQGTFSATKNILTAKYFYYYLASQQHIQVKSLKYGYWFDMCYQNGSCKGQIRCIASPADAISNKICRGYTMNQFTVDGNGNNSYLI